jgi:hypothetical protein
VNGRVSGFYSGYDQGIQKISYYNDSYQTFVHHSISGVSKQNLGVEAAVKYNVIKNVNMTFSGAWSKYTYTNNPMELYVTKMDLVKIFRKGWQSKTTT